MHCVLKSRYEYQVVVCLIRSHPFRGHIRNGFKNTSTLSPAVCIATRINPYLNNEGQSYVFSLSLVHLDIDLILVLQSFLTYTLQFDFFMIHFYTDS